MKIHWYWPFARPEELSWALATCSDADSMVIQVIDRPAAPLEASATGGVRLIRDLQDVDRADKGRLRWLTSRAMTYLHRHRQRSRSWAARMPDLAHVHYMNRFTDLWWGRSRPNVLVLSVHDVTPHITRGPQNIERWMLRRIYRSADALIVHHDSLRERLISEFGIAPAQIHVIGHQVFPVPVAMSSDVRPPGPPTVLFFGALRPNKGVSVLCDAIQMIDESSGIRFHFAGRGDAGVEDALNRFADRHDRVTAEIGFVEYDRKAELFRSASVVVLPYTNFSSQSGVLHDAYGHGRPVIVTDVGALGESVREDGTGWVVAPGEPAELARAIAAILEDTATMAQMEAAARQVSIDRSPESLGRQLRDIYEQLAT